MLLTLFIFNYHTGALNIRHKYKGSQGFHSKSVNSFFNSFPFVIIIVDEDDTAW